MCQQTDSCRSHVQTLFRNYFFPWKPLLKFYNMTPDCKMGDKTNTVNIISSTEAIYCTGMASVPQTPYNRNNLIQIIYIIKKVPLLFKVCIMTNAV